ncbi:hypothetical protein ACWCP6_19465 [Streptomyces sp. NPDC002004]
MWDRGSQVGVVILWAGLPGATFLPGWASVIAEVRATCLGAGRRAGHGLYPEPVETYGSTLERSAFSDQRSVLAAVGIVPFDQLVVRSLDEPIGLQLSNSYFMSARLGAWCEALGRDLCEALVELDSLGYGEEAIHIEALIATRL